jgi:hypothetical protein
MRHLFVSRRKRRSGNQALWLVLALAASLSSGCGSGGPARASVTGKVEFDGQPVTEGTILFVPTGDTKGPAAGTIIKDGSYTLSAKEGPVIGKNKVEIKGTRKTGKKVKAVPPASGEFDETEQYIPYNFNTKTTLEKEIKSGENGIDFKMTKS